jgi:pimeloyl-ACP methyl ester carboxylesterase
MARATKAVAVELRKLAKLIPQILLLLALCSASAIGQTPLTYQASIGSGVHSITGFESGSNCNGPYYNSVPFQVIWGPLTLRSDLHLIKKNGAWLPASVTETGVASLGYPQSTYMSTITPDGIVRTIETGAFDSTASQEQGSINSEEVIDLNTGKYTWHRQINETYGGSCPGSQTEVQDRTGDLPVTLSPYTPALPTLNIVNPTLINGNILPSPTSVPAASVPNAPGAAGLAADGISAIALVYQSATSDPVNFSISATGFTTEIGTLGPYADNYLSLPSSGSGQQLTVQSPLNAGDCVAGSTTPCIFLALYWAPSQMPVLPANLAVGNFQNVLVTVQASQTPSSGTSPDTVSDSIPLEPPPLVLVHGIWSSASQAWPPFLNWLQNGMHYPHQFIYTADYGATSHLSFKDQANQQVLAETIAIALLNARQNGLAAQRVDVVGHSMGGLLTRYFMANGVPQPFPSNYLPKDSVHKLITIGAPQDGSPFAGFLLQNQGAAPQAGVVPEISAVCSVFSSACTLSNLLSTMGMRIDTGVQSLVLGLPSSSQAYSSIVGQAPDPSRTGLLLGAVINLFVAGKTVDGILGTPNDTIVPGPNQNVGAAQSATITGIVHTPIACISILCADNTGETASSAVWSQALYWLMGGTAPQGASTTATFRVAPYEKIKPETSTSGAPAPIFDLTGYTQVDASNVTVTPATGTALTIGSSANIAATSTAKTLSEILLFQQVSDPTDLPVSYSTEAPFSIPYVPTRLGTANFVAIAVFADNTYATIPLSYPLQPSGNPLLLTVNSPDTNLPIGLTTIISAQVGYNNGPVDVTRVATYVARSGGSKVISAGANGTITTTGNGRDWLDVGYGGLTGSAEIIVGSCTYQLSPTNQLIEQTGGTATIQVTTQSGCSWTADTGGASWLSVSGGSGTGTGSITVSAANNSTSSTQTAFITVADQDVAVVQPATTCTFAVSPSQAQAPSSGTSGTLSVTTSCPLVASSSVPWIAVTPLSSTVDYVVFPNPTSNSRTGTITIGDQSVSVTQAGGSSPSIKISAASSTLTIPAPGGNASAAIQVVAVQGFSGSVSLSCTVTYQGAGTATNLPTCTVTPAQGQVTSSNSLASTVSISTSAPTSASNLKGFGFSSFMAVAAISFFGLLPRRRWAAAALILALTGMTMLSGCGGGGGSSSGSNNPPPNPGTTTGNYQVVVTATSGSLTASSTLALSIQ